jgi:tellurite resistance protein TerC
MIATDATPMLWIGFGLFVVLMMVLDLAVFHRRAHVVKPREALIWSCVWIGLSLGFAGLLHVWMGRQQALEFLTGWVIEKALSVDNLFVFIVIFSYFSVPAKLQHRVLFWGIVGALAMRALFIFAGASLLQRFHWLLYVFGLFLVITGLRLLLLRDAEVHPENNPVLKLVRRYVPSVADYRGAHFFVHEGGRRLATPLLFVLVTIEVTDIVFAVDSIPAVFAVTQDPFIVFSSNIFAILGLRALYFVLAGVLGKFRFLKVGLALVLMFVGAKMLLEHWYEIPVGISLAVVGVLLLGSILISLLRPEKPTSVDA